MNEPPLVDVWAEPTRGQRWRLAMIRSTDAPTIDWINAHFQNPSGVLSWYWKPDINAWIIRVRKGTRPAQNRTRPEGPQKGTGIP